MSRFLLKSAYIIVDMGKKIISLLLVLCLVFSFSACDSADTGVSIEGPVKVAVGIEDGRASFAAKEYAVDNGYELLEFETQQAAIIAVENGKADFVILNSDKTTAELINNTELLWVENTEFKIQYCAVMKQGNDALASKVNNAIVSLKSKDIPKKINKAFFDGVPYESTDSPIGTNSMKVLCSPVFDDLLYTDKSGVLAGKELEFINEICNELSSEAQITVITEYDNMFTTLEDGVGDIIISAVEYTPELENEYVLSDAYNETTFGVYKRK